MSGQKYFIRCFTVGVYGIEFIMHNKRDRRKCMDIKLGKLLGTGAGSDVYEIGNDKVLKLYKRNSIGNIDYEYNKSLTVYKNGLPIPKIYEIIEYNGQRGFIMEQIKGESFLQIMLNNIDDCYNKGMSCTETFYSPVNIELIEKTATTLFHLHEKSCSALESAQGSLKMSCKYNQYLTEQEKNIVYSLIDNLPVADNVCHGDPNPGNFIIRDDKIRLIDWNNCVKASPLYDITEYTLMMKYSDTSVDSIENKHIAEYLRECKEEYIKLFIESYSKLSDVNISNMDIWIIPLLVSKMGGNNTLKKQEGLLADIRNRLRIL